MTMVHSKPKELQPEHHQFHKSRNLFLFLFAILPLVWVTVLSFIILSKGTPGFRVENTQNYFLVSHVDMDINPLKKGDRITRSSGMDYHNILGHLLFSGRYKANYVNEVTFTRDDRETTLPLKYAPLMLADYLQALGPHLFSIFAIMSLCIVALLRAPPGQPAGLLTITLTLFSLIITTEFPLHFGVLHPSIQSFVFLSIMLTNWFAFSSWAHYILRFPVERQLFVKQPWLISAIYLVPPFVAIVGSFLMAGQSVEFFGWLHRLRLWSVPVIITGTWFKQLYDFHIIKSPLVRNQLKLCLTGGFIGISVYLFFYLTPNIIIGHPLIPFRMVIIFGSLIPLVLFLSIIRYRLLDVDRIISGGITYIVLGLGLIISYTWFIALLKRFFWGREILSEELFIVYILIIAIIFNPIKNLLQNLIDRIFFQDQLNYRSLLHDFSRRIVTAIKLPDLVNIVINTLPDEFKIQKAGLIIFEEQKNRIYPKRLFFNKTQWAQSRVVEILKGNKEYILYQDDQSDPKLTEELPEIMQGGFSLIFGLKSGTAFQGLLFLGSKKSNKFYSGNEIHILSTLANQVAIALENALIYQSLKESQAELSKMFDKVVQSEKLATIGEMTSVLAHEIKNPLSIIRSSAQYLIEGSRGKETQKELLDFIVDEVDNLNLVVNNLLGLARYKPPDFKPINITEKVESVLEHWLQSNDHNPDISIRFNEHGSRYLIYADERQLSQVFINLIRNSEDVMPEGGELTIEFADDKEKDGIILLFIDSGPGIPEEYSEEIFKKFFTTKEKGMGLGLPVCRQIINAHSGNIDLENNDGRGSTAKIWLPKRPHTALKNIHLCNRNSML